MVWCGVVGCSVVWCSVVWCGVVWLSGLMWYTSVECKRCSVMLYKIQLVERRVFSKSLMLNATTKNRVFIVFKRENIVILLFCHFQS